MTSRVCPRAHAPEGGIPETRLVAQHKTAKAAEGEHDATLQQWDHEGAGGRPLHGLTIVVRMLDD